VGSQPPIDEDGSMALRDLRRQAAALRPGDGTGSGSAGRRAPGRTDPDVPAASRRRFLRGAAGGAALGATAFALVGAPEASAQSPGTTPGSSPGTTESAPEAAAGSKQPTVSGSDLELGRFLHSVELALQEVYTSALDGGKLKPAARDQAITFREQHRLQAVKLVDAIQSSAASGPNPGLLQSLQPRVANAGSEVDVINALVGIENSAAATYQYSVGQAKDWQFIGTVASIGAVDGQHATAWSQKAAPDLAAWVAGFDAAVPVVQGTEGRWDPAQYPAR
jgi:hypothetical protein